MDTLFTEIDNQAKRKVAPLAVRMRPETLDDLMGQEEAVGPGSWLRTAIEKDRLTSVILYGPAGTGKTSIAHIIAHTTKAVFVEVSAVGGTVADPPVTSTLRSACCSTAAGRSCSSMRFTASTAASRMRCCTRWRTAS